MVAISPREQGADAVSRLVSSIWRDVFGIAPPVGATFFDAGGDSLRASQLVSRLNAQFGVELPLRAVFDAPTVGAIAALVRREIDVAGIGEGAPEASEPSSSDATTLSFSQERMWFMHALAADSAAYNIPLAFRLRGRLDVRRLRAALQRVVERHAVLTTKFPTGPAGPRAQPRPLESVGLPEIRMDVPADGDPRAVIDDRLAELTGKPFDLERGPLLRATLVHVAPDDAVLLVVMHHIITDQWSLDVFSEELAQAYGASGEEANNTPQPEPEPEPGSYEQYAAWHRRWFTERRLTKELAYWRRQLAGLEPLSLTGDYIRPPQPTFRGAHVRVPIDAQDLRIIASLGAAHGASLAMVLLAALNVLLYRYTGRTDIAVGVPIANRHHPGSEGLLGVLVNTLVARTSLDGNPDFRTVLERVRAVMLEAFDHQDMPFELLVRELQLSRDGNRSPLFSVMFNMLNTPPRNVQFAELVCSRFNFDRRAAQFDLTVTIDVFHDQSISFEYSTDVFARPTIERLAQHYLRILRYVVSDAAGPIATLPMLAEDELARLSRWGHGPAVKLPDRTVPQHLQESFRRVPKAVAVRCGNKALTYEALRSAAERVARALRERGYGRGSRVGLCLWRSPFTVIAQLGILQSGAAYVPLDASYPPERIGYMVRDSGLSAIVSTGQLFPVLRRSHAEVELIDIEAVLDSDDWLQHADRQGTVEPAADATPQDAAYVIYTSGSTGNPKGVEVSHRAVVNLLRSMAAEPGLVETDRLLAVTTLSFDISVLELLLPLSVGAEVIIATREQLADGATLGGLIRTAGATVMQATASTWRMLIDSGWRGDPNLRALVGGEPLSRRLAGDMLSRCHELWNMYGPTETTVWSTCWKVDAGALDRISIGRPIANTSLHVLDANLQAVPIGAAGELFIAGDGVAIGYVNQPELTAERFLVDPQGVGAGIRLYRTGDRARWRHDGTLEHLGRLDSQIKIRGYRIELGEIETHLAAHPEVAGAVACVADDDRGDACIVACVVPRDEMLEPAVYRTYLQQWLPSYMLPQYFVELDAIPLLASGKIDRVGLVNATTDVRKARVTAPPRDEREGAIHRVWAEVLGDSHFGVHDSFFDLGGHSLLAVRVASRITRELGVPCALPMLFRYPTVATLAAALAPARDAHDDSVVALRSEGDGPPVFCISGVELYRPLAERLAPQFPVYGVFSPAEAAYWSAADQAPSTSVRELAADYLALVRAYRPAGPYVLVGFSVGGVIAYEMAQQLTAAGAEVPFLLILDSDPPRLDAASRQDGPLSAQSIRTGARALFELSSRLRSFGGFRGAIGGATLDEFRVRRQRYQAAMRAYHARPYFGRAMLVETAEGRTFDPGHAWNALIPEIEIHRISSTHLKIFEPPYINGWAKKVQAALESLRV